MAKPDPHFKKVLKGTPLTLRRTASPSGQYTWEGQVRLKEPQDMLNRANDGKEPWDKRWKHPSSVNVPAGTLVDIRIQETLSGVYSTVTYQDDRGTFYANRKISNEP